MLHPTVIGLTGYKGSGKSVVARRLSSYHQFARRPFAYHLKAMCSALGVPPEVLDGDDAAKSVPLDILNGKTPRHAMQTLGTEWGRNCLGEDFWVNRWLSGVACVPRIVADDVRFPNEADAIRKLGGVILRVTRPGVAPTDGHASENPDAIFADCVILNDSTEDALRVAIDHWVYGWVPGDKVVASDLATFTDAEVEKYSDEDTDAFVRAVEWHLEGKA